MEELAVGYKVVQYCSDVEAVHLYDYGVIISFSKFRRSRRNACLSSKRSLNMSQGSSSARQGIRKLGKENLTL